MILKHGTVCLKANQMEESACIVVQWAQWCWKPEGSECIGYDNTLSEFAVRCTYTKQSNSIPNDRILDWSKMKAFADDISGKCDQILEICFGKGRKHCGKRGKCWLPGFSPFPTMFSKAFYFRVV